MSEAVKITVDEGLHELQASVSKTTGHVTSSIGICNKGTEAEVRIQNIKSLEKALGAYLDLPAVQISSKQPGSPHSPFVRYDYGNEVESNYQATNLGMSPLSDICQNLPKVDTGKTTGGMTLI